MKKKGNPRKLKKAVRNRPKQTVTGQYGYIPKYRHFCIICKLADKVINNKNLTVHHDKTKADGGNNRLSNLEVICQKHHMQLHHKYFYKKIKEL